MEWLPERIFMGWMTDIFKQTTEEAEEIPKVPIPAEELPQITLISRECELAVLSPAAGALAVDLETLGLDPRADKVRLVSITDTAGSTWVVDAFHVPLEALSAILADRELIFHNAAFDLGFLHDFREAWRLGVYCPTKITDTMLLSRILYNGEAVAPIKRKATSHTLAAATERELGKALDKSEQLANWSGPLTLEMIRYAAEDTRILFPLQATLEEKIAAAGLPDVAELESRVIPAVVWLRSSGAPVDVVRWRSLANEHEKRAAEALADLEELAPINWRSGEQVKAFFSNDLGIRLRNTKEDTLRRVENPVAERLLEYRKAAKYASTYGEEWLRYVSDGRVYADWIQIGPETGRMACSKPNLQNVPREAGYRSMFTAPEGSALVTADFSQIELRVAAKIAGEKAMLDAYLAGEDLHTKTAKEITGKAEISKTDRTLAKALGFGLLYGMSSSGLKGYAKALYGLDLSDKEAATHRAAFFDTYPSLAAWQAHVAESSLEETRTLTGRRHRNLGSVREALNTPIQGTAADGQKLALALLWERRHECPDAFPVLTVHDEVVIQCDKDKFEEAREWLISAMEDGMNAVVNASEPRVPIEIEATISDSWVK
jgi:DNA polymerase-1